MLGVISDAARLDHPAHGGAQFGAGDEHRPRFGGKKLDSRFLAQAAFAQIIIHQQRGLVGRSRTLVLRCRGQDDNAPARKTGQRVADRGRTFHRVDAESRFGEAGNDLRRILRTQSNHQRIGTQGLPIDFHFPLGGINPRDIAPAKFDAAAQQPVQWPGKILRSPLIHHQP